MPHSSMLIASCRKQCVKTRGLLRKALGFTSSAAHSSAYFHAGMLPNSSSQMIRNNSKICNVPTGRSSIEARHLCYLADLSRTHTICVIPEKAKPN